MIGWVVFGTLTQKSAKVGSNKYKPHLANSAVSDRRIEVVVSKMEITSHIFFYIRYKGFRGTSFFVPFIIHLILTQESSSESGFATEKVATSHSFRAKMPIICRKSFQDRNFSYSAITTVLLGHTPTISSSPIRKTKLSLGSEIMMCLMLAH